MGENGNKRVKRLCIRLSERDAYMLDYVSTRMKRPKSEIVRRALRNVCVAENYGYTDYVPNVEIPVFNDYGKSDINVRISAEELSMIREVCEKTGKTCSDVFRNGLTMLYNLYFVHTE